MNKKVLAGIIIVLVLAGVGGYFLLMQKPAGKNETANQEPVKVLEPKIVAYIGYSTTQPFWLSLGSYIQKEADKREVKFIDLTPQTLDPQDQKKSLDIAVSGKISGIILGAGGDPTVLNSGLDKALELGIPVVAVDTKLDHPAVKGFLTTDNLAGAKLAGDYIVQATGGKGTVLILGGTLNHPNGDARRDGVKEEVERAGMKVIFKQADWEDEKAYQFTKEELDKANDIVAIFSAWDPGIIAAAKAVTEKGLEGKMIMVGFDGLSKNLEEIKAGNLSATVAQPIEQIGTKGADTMIDILAGKEVEEAKLIPGILVTKENVDYFLSE